jgi:hypothetical protein
MSFILAENIMGIKDRFQDSADWILNDPKSLVILMLMASGIGGFFFLMLTLASVFGRNWLFVVLFGFIGYVAISKFLSLIKAVKKFGISRVYGGMTANEFVWHKGGEDHGITGSGKYEGDAVGCERDEKPVGKIGEEVRNVYRKSERLGEDAGDGLQPVEADSK